MKAKAAGQRKMLASVGGTVRASASSPPDGYRALGRIARGKKVSLAWLARDASENRIAEDRSLLVKTRQRKET